jgi:phosphoglycerate-specific signal transduction histidine kinase
LLLSAKQTAVGELAGGVAHEVNNPLQIILSRVQLMVVQQSRAADDNPKLVDGLALIGNNVKRISRIIRVLLGFASHNTVEAQGQPSSLSAVIHQACALTRHQLEQQMMSSDICIEQVFFNLLLNAENAMSASGGGHLVIDACRQEDGLEIRFQDDGTAFPHNTPAGFSSSSLQPVPTAVARDSDWPSATGLSKTTVAR